MAQRDADKAFKEAMDEERDGLREHNYAYTEFLLTPPEEEEEATTAPDSEPVTGDTDDTETVVADADGTDAEEEAEEPEPEGYARLDIHLREAMRVLVDAVEISDQPQFAERVPLTARSSRDG
jgi:carboxyl-terminal processing protease